MGDGIIKVNEEIDQVVQNLDGVVGSYDKQVAQLAGEQGGAAEPFFSAMQRGREAIELKFQELDSILEQVAQAMKASINDHRATEAEISDEVLRRLNEIAEAESNSQPLTQAQSVSAPSGTPPENDSPARPDGSL